mgnify:CR=1 FL=1
MTDDAGIFSGLKVIDAANFVAAPAAATILADFGTRYQSKLFNPEFLKQKGLPSPDWLE